MKQRFLLDRIDLCRDKTVPDQREELAALIDSHSASATVIWCDLAIMGAEGASDKPMWERFIIQRGLEITGRVKHDNAHEIKK